MVKLPVGGPELALWHGPPSLARQRELEQDYFCDNYNRRGGGYGAMYRRIQGRWVKYAESDYKPLPASLRTP